MGSNEAEHYLDHVLESGADIFLCHHEVSFLLFGQLHVVSSLVPLVQGKTGREAVTDLHVKLGETVAYLEPRLLEPRAVRRRLMECRRMLRLCYEFNEAEATEVAKGQDVVHELCDCCDR